MSLFNRKEKITTTIIDGDFSIFQFEKIKGLKSQKEKKFSPTEYISPIYGYTVKDVTVAPYINVATGDKAKQYDFLREKPIGDPSTYDEFKGVIVTTDTRREIFGEDVEVDKNRKYVDPRKIKATINVPYTGNEHEETFVDVFKGEEFHRPFQDRQLETKTGFDNHEEVVRQEPPQQRPIEPQPEVKVERELEPELNRDYEMPYEPVNEAMIEPSKPQVYEPEAHVREPVINREYEEPVTPVQEPIREPERAPIRQEAPRPQAQPKAQRAYKFPTIDMFSKQDRDQHSRPEWLLVQEQAINDTLETFDVPGKVKNIIKGPTVTRHEIELEPGVNVRTVERIEANLRMELAAVSTRIEAPIPGKSFVGLEVPNDEPEIVMFGNVIDDKKFLDSSDKPLMVALGVDIDGENIFADIKGMPHGLIAGATNSGKSVCVNTIIMSLLMKNHPDDLKLILIDPKMVEMSIYNDLPHLATPVITDPKVASMALSWAVEEMEERFIDFSESRVKDLEGYNRKAATDPEMEKKPYIVIIIDELADLMMVSSQDVEQSVQRITQKARAAGIHLLIATQRPTTDVVKGTIKANIPARIAFRVASHVDSTTILDGAGAELLLGKGDMLYKTMGRPVRLQGCYVKDSEIEFVTDFIRDQMEPNYLIELEDLKTFHLRKETMEADDLLEDVIQYVVREQTASINRIQNEFSIGFNRAQRIVDMLEEQGIVSESEGTKARRVLITLADLGQE